MANLTHFYYEMKDGTVKQINPFTGTEVWSVPGRGNRPLTNVAGQKHEAFTPLPKEKENYCDFCAAHYRETPPEKERIIEEEGTFSMRRMVPAGSLNDELAYFRRCSNLFEIVTYNYWQKNYGYKLSPDHRKWKETYLSTETGKNHVLNIINTKMKLMDLKPEQISDDEKLETQSDPLFGGCHDLVIGGRHFAPDAAFTDELWSAGSMSPEEHYQYIRMTIYGMKEIFRYNRFVRYISVFQNWLSSAGASFDHIHRQLVGLDEWGPAIEQEHELVQKNRNVFNEYHANFAGYNDLIFAENDHALAFASFGHRFPTIAVYSRSNRCRPMEHTQEEIRGVSDLIHAVHAAMGAQISCNEEWFYSPPDALEPIPWHILIKWRVNTQAGFEGGTRIYINPISPSQLRDRIVPKLFEVREKGLIAPDIHIAEECRITYNPLKYFQASSYR